MPTLYFLLGFAAIILVPIGIFAVLRARERFYEE